MPLHALHPHGRINRRLHRGLWLLALCSGLCFSEPAQAETITVVADQWCPYNCAENEEKRGYMVEIARAALAKSGVTIEYKTMPWSRALELTRKGDFDALIGAAKSDAEGFVYPKTVQGFAEMQLWTKPESQWVFSGVESFQNMSIGAIADYSYSDAVDAYLQDHLHDKDHIQLVGGDTPMELNLRKLAAGRIDVMLEDKNVLFYHFSSQGKSFPLRDAGSLMETEPRENSFLYVAFSPNKPNSQHYADLLDQGMQALRQSGELKKILDSYHIEDWEQTK